MPRRQPQVTPPPTRPTTASGAAIVSRCLRGDEEAWVTLVNRYKRLIYSVPFRYGATPDDAADIFQAVCVELYEALPKLRNVDSLRAWLMTVTTHQSFHWKQRARRRYIREGTELDEELPAAAAPVPDPVLDVERAHVLHDAITRLSPRCQEIVRLLFFREPPLPYTELAAQLGLATGSIGFIRGRCLNKLEKELARAGFTAG